MPILEMEVHSTYWANNCLQRQRFCFGREGPSRNHKSQMRRAVANSFKESPSFVEKCATFNKKVVMRPLLPSRDRGRGLIPMRHFFTEDREMQQRVISVQSWSVALHSLVYVASNKRIRASQGVIAPHKSSPGSESSIAVNQCRSTDGEILLNSTWLPSKLGQFNLKIK